jgi:hypothetical protein
MGQPSGLIIGGQVCMGLEHGSRGIVTVKHPLPGAASEGCNRLRIPTVPYSDL